MTIPSNVGRATLEHLAQDGLFDLGERFEEWLRSLQNAHSGLAINYSTLRSELL